MPAGVLSIDALFGLRGTEPNEAMRPHPAELIEAADVILAHDWTTTTEAVVYGAGRLVEIIESRRMRRARILRIGLDADSPDFQRLLAIVRAVKGAGEHEDGRR